MMHCNSEFALCSVKYLYLILSHSHCFTFIPKSQICNRVNFEKKQVPS